MPALLLGSISTLADTSELQRQAFNEAFAAHGLDWQWDRDQYRSMLSESGGQARIAAYARARGQSVDAKAIHGTKTRIFQERLASAEVTPRTGVEDSIKDAKGTGWKTGLVTTTSPGNVAALLNALSPVIRPEYFDVIVDASAVETPKPDPAAYLFALDKLGEAPQNCVAVEDNVGGLQAAIAAGVPCVAFPNENTTGDDFSGALRCVQWLIPGDLLGAA